jgi:hypothetical protein
VSRTARLPLVLAVGSALVLLTGCGKSGGFQREVVVQFKLPAGVFTPPAASVAAIQAHCTHTPGTTMEPVPGPTALPSVRLNGIRFNVAGADDKTIATLEACLQSQPDVTSADLEDDDS